MDAQPGDKGEIHAVVDERGRAALPRQPPDRFYRHEQIPVGHLLLADLEQPDPHPEEPPSDLGVIVDPGHGPVGDRVDGRKEEIQGFKFQVSGFRFQDAKPVPDLKLET